MTLLTWSLTAKHTEFCLAAGPQQPKAVDDPSRRAGLQASIAAATTISWPAGGRADHNGAIVGGSVLVRVDRATALDGHATEQQRKVAAHCRVRVSAAHAIVSKAVAFDHVHLSCPSDCPRRPCCSAAARGCCSCTLTPLCQPGFAPLSHVRFIAVWRWACISLQQHLWDTGAMPSTRPGQAVYVAVGPSSSS